MADKLTEVLVGHHVPDAVARQNEKLVFFRFSRFDVNFRGWRHQLFGRSLNKTFRKLAKVMKSYEIVVTSAFDALVFKVAEGPGDG